MHQKGMDDQNRLLIATKLARKRQVWWIYVREKQERGEKWSAGGNKNYFIDHV